CYDSCYDSCCWDPCNMNFELGADFLWWKPCVDDLDYAAKNTKDSPREYKFKNICPDWEPGVRVYLGIPNLYCDWGLTASYTYINSDDSSSASSTGDDDIIHVIQHPGLEINNDYECGKGEWDATYHDWDILANYNISCKKCHQFSPYFGVAGICLEQNLKITLDDSSTSEKEITKWDSDYWGVGLRLGSGYQYRFSDCLSFFVKGDGTILAGEADSKIKFDDNDSNSNHDLSFKDSKDCQIIPGYHIRAGFIYDTCLCDWDFSLRLGYEFLMWHNVPNHRTFVGNDFTNGKKDAAISTSSNTRTFGFHGLLAGMSVSF
ncbi:MAG: hypothetical protein K940chlam7_02027, partial [Chlamydiae bacterium]|nr:hypothetical protein [Chlamydiota bacterium]